MIPIKFVEDNEVVPSVYFYINKGTNNDPIDPKTNIRADGLYHYLEHILASFLTISKYMHIDALKHINGITDGDYLFINMTLFNSTDQIINLINDFLLFVNLTHMNGPQFDNELDMIENEWFNKTFMIHIYFIILDVIGTKNQVFGGNKETLKNKKLILDTKKNINESEYGIVFVNLYKETINEIKSLYDNKLSFNHIKNKSTSSFTQQQPNIIKIYTYNHLVLDTEVIILSNLPKIFLDYIGCIQPNFVYANKHIILYTNQEKEFDDESIDSFVSYVIYDFFKTVYSGVIDNDINYALIFKHLLFEYKFSDREELMNYFVDEINKIVFNVNDITFIYKDSRLKIEKNNKIYSTKFIKEIEFRNNIVFKNNITKGLKFSSIINIIKTDDRLKVSNPFLNFSLSLKKNQYMKNDLGLVYLIHFINLKFGSIKPIANYTNNYFLTDKISLNELLEFEEEFKTFQEIYKDNIKFIFDNSLFFLIDKKNKFSMKKIIKSIKVSNFKYECKEDNKNNNKVFNDIIDLDYYTNVLLPFTNIKIDVDYIYLFKHSSTENNLFYHIIIAEVLLPKIMTRLCQLRKTYSYKISNNYGFNYIICYIMSASNLNNFIINEYNVLKLNLDSILSQSMTLFLSTFPFITNIDLVKNTNVDLNIDINKLDKLMLKLFISS